MNFWLTNTFSFPQHTRFRLFMYSYTPSNSVFKFLQLTIILLFAKIFSRSVFYLELKNIQIWRCGKWTTPCVGVSYDFIVGGFLWSITRILNHLSLINLYYYPLIFIFGYMIAAKDCVSSTLTLPQMPQEGIKGCCRGLWLVLSKYICHCSAPKCAFVCVCVHTFDNILFQLIDVNIIIPLIWGIINVIDAGVESIAVEGQHKNEVVVIGNGIDIVKLAARLRKKVGYTDVVTVSQL